MEYKQNGQISTESAGEAIIKRQVAVQSELHALCVSV